MSNWFEDLLAKARQLPAPTPGGGKPSSPVAPFPVLLPAQVRSVRWDRRWRRLLGTGVQPGLAEYPQILFAALALNLFGLDDYFPDDQTGWGSLSVGAGAGGNSSAMGLVNPAGSGVLGIITYCSAFASAACNIELANDSVAGATPGNFSTTPGWTRDSRGGWTVASTKILLGTVNTVGDLRQTNPLAKKPVANATTIAEWTGSTETGFAVISPGHLIYATPDILVTGVTAEWRWREVPIPLVTG
jgi:hypothetical protein